MSNLCTGVFCFQGKDAIPEEDTGPPCVSPLYDDVRMRKTFPQDEERWRVVAIVFSYFSIAVTLGLVLATLITAGVSGSAAALGAGLDTLLSVISSLVIVWRYGESRYQPESTATQDFRATLAVVLMFLLGSLVIFVVTVKALLEEHVMKSAENVMVIFTIAAVCYIGLYFLKSVVAERLSSRAMTVDALDSLAAGVICLAIICGAVIAKYFPKVWFIDESLALCIAVVMSIYGFRLLHELFAPKEYTVSLQSDNWH